MYTGFFVSGMISKIYSQVKFFKNQGTKKKKKTQGTEQCLYCATICVKGKR